MLFIKVVPANYDKILSRCSDLDIKFLKEHEDSQSRLGDSVPYYATNRWTDRLGRENSYSVLFREVHLNEEMDFPHGKSETDWFQATRKHS